MDLKLLRLTRGLSRFAIDRAAYARCFGEDPAVDFAPHFEALEAARLVRSSPHEIALTPEGRLYADSVTGLLAHARVTELRKIDRGAMHDRMG